jgi:hypothetical protein
VSKWRFEFIGDMIAPITSAPPGRIGHAVQRPGRVFF